MIQSIYSSVSNADSVSCRKGTVIKSDPIPLLRDKYLGEYRTELEKAKVRKNLGIPDKNNLEWGNIEGFVEAQTDLVNYVESKWHYTTELNEEVKNIQEAMDYALFFVTNFKGEHDAVVELQESVEVINGELTNIQELIAANATDIDSLEESLKNINSAIEQLNEDLLSINVDANILAWVESKLENSNSIKLTESLEVVVSEQSDNALQLLEHQEAIEADPENGIEASNEILPGLYIKDLTPSITQLEEQQTEINQNISNLNTTIDQLSEDIESISNYDTEMSDDTTVPTQVGGIQVGTTAASLKGKSIIEILDTMLFPTTVRNLNYPTLYYSSISNLVEVGSSVDRPQLIFTQNDAGEEESREDKLTFNGSEVDSYDQLGTYIYSGSVTYAAGEYLVNNKGETTDKRVEAGTLTTSTSVTTTYPWYAGNTSQVTKQQLVKFNLNSGTMSFSASGQAIVKLPGENSTIESFKVDGGLGYLDIDLNGWEESTETLNGITYKVLTKKDSYPSVLPHQINFKLSL